MVSRRHSDLLEPQQSDEFLLENDHGINQSDLSKRFEAAVNSSGEHESIEYELFGREFLQAVKRGNPATVEAYLNAGMPINYRDSRTRQTALHIAAACQAREVIRLLSKRPGCNFILRDRHGRLPSELAYVFGGDPALARYLTIKEFKQAKVIGFTLKYRETLLRLN